jgi:aspartate-semialdehyde dehydrogenase
MELGGNAPFIVLPDMDVVEAAQAAVDAKFQTSGQDCLAANRIFVPREKYNAFLEAFQIGMAKLKVGCSGLMEPDTFMRDNIVNHRGVNNDPKTQLQAVPQGI